MTTELVAKGTRRARRKWGNVKQLPSGRFLARYTSPEDGTLRAIKGTFATRTEAESALNRTRVAVEDGAWVDPKRVPTLAAYVEHFNLVRRTRDGAPVKPSTRVLSDGQFRNYILPAFGHLRLDAITLPAVKRWHAQLPHSPSHSRAVYSLLHTVLTMAVEEELIRKNPCRVRGAGSANTYEERPLLSLSQAESIIALMPAPERAIADVALHTQARRGELLALRWSNVDLEAGTIFIRRTLAANGAEVPTKSKRTRTITLDDETIELLGSIRRDESARVFVRADGSEMREWHVARAWAQAREEAGLPGAWFHDMRHTGLTVLSYEGLPIKELMARAGHSTSVASLNYQHRAESMKRSASDAFARALSKDRSARAQNRAGGSDVICGASGGTVLSASPS